MANILAAAVTSQVISRKYSGKLPYGNPVGRQIEVDVLLTVTPLAADAYPTGGIPLTSAFTEASGEWIDTGLDVTQDIFELGGKIAKNSGGVAITCPALFNHTGTTAATQVLLLQSPQPALPVATFGTITAADIAVASSTSITQVAAGLVTAGFQVGDIILITGFLGAKAPGNGITRVTVVAAGALTVEGGPTAQTAGDTVTIRTLFRPGAQAFSEYRNVDVTLPGGIAQGAVAFAYRTTLVGTFRATVSRSYTVSQ